MLCYLEYLDSDMDGINDADDDDDDNDGIDDDGTVQTCWKYWVFKSIFNFKMMRMMMEMAFLMKMKIWMEMVFQIKVTFK